MVSKKHVHAELMRLYAEDALTTVEPWRLWEVFACGIWCNIYDHPRWYQGVLYRRRPRTITINGIEVPEPLRQAPKTGSTYFVVSITQSGPHELRWRGEVCDFRWFTRGLCHATHEAAELHAKALLSFTIKG